MTLQATARVHRSGFHLDVSVDVAGGAVLAVVGPNGAGKSTLLRLLAGLPVGGDVDATVLVGGRDVSGIPTERRPIGVAFQDLRLFPHLDAVANVAFPLRAQGRSRPDARAAAEAELAALGIDEATGRRRPHALSGGEAQRVGLARALVSAPELLLLDEPFAAVDAEFRPTARAALTARLRGFTGATVLVTHDPADALLLGDRILVLEDGRATQHASAAEVARRPASRYAANLVGTNLLVATPRGRSCRTAAGTDVVVADDLGTDADGSVAPDAGPFRVGLIVPPSAVALHPTRPVGTPRNVWPVRVGAVELLGTRARVVVVLPSGEELVAEVTLAAIDELGIAAGADLWASVKATEIAVVGGLRT